MAVIVSPAFAAEPVDDVGAKDRCAVCGMFVQPYQDWLAQIHLADGTVEFFDGVKDMMVFFHNPAQYRPGTLQADITAIWVRDYYTLEWLDGKKAFYVIGSDVYGPMGHEFIPFASEKAAVNFLKDHKGKKVVPFAEISDEMVQSMRSGMKMKNH